MGLIMGTAMGLSAGIAAIVLAICVIQMSKAAILQAAGLNPAPTSRRLGHKARDAERGRDYDGVDDDDGDPNAWMNSHDHRPFPRPPRLGINRVYPA